MVANTSTDSKSNNKHKNQSFHDNVAVYVSFQIYW